MHIGIGLGITKLKSQSGAAVTVPGTMAAPALAQVDQTRLLVTRAAAPATGGSAILSYDLRYSTDQIAWTVVAGIGVTQTITGLTAGTLYFVQNRAVNAVGAAAWSASASLSTVVAAPVNSVLPVISGTAQQGQTLSVSNGTWSNSPTGFAWQWKRGGVAISGATAATYLLVVADVGSTITCTVTASNAGGSNAATSAATGTITSGATVPAAMAAPSLAQIDRTSLLHTQAAAPANGGSAITSYDLRYSTDQATWTTLTNVASPATVTGLLAGTVYFLQTRAVNAIGAAAWSPSAFKDTVFDYSLYNEAGSTTIAVTDLAGMRVFSGGVWVTLASLGVSVAQDVAGELLISGFASASVATAIAAAGLHFEQQQVGEPYSAVDTVATANTTGTSIRGLHYLQTGLVINNAPQPGFPLMPTRELFPVTG